MPCTLISGTGVMMAHFLERICYLYVGSEKVQELLNILIQSAIEFPEPVVS